MQTSSAHDVSNGKYTLKENEQEARERLRAFWAGESLGRPALGVSVKDRSFKPLRWEESELDNALKDISPEYQLLRAQNYMTHLQYRAEAMPGYAIAFGSHIPLLAVLLGGDFEYDLDRELEWGAFAWIKPWEDVYQQPIPSFSPDLPLVRATPSQPCPVFAPMDSFAWTLSRNP